MTWDELNIQYEAAHELAALYQKRGDSDKFHYWFSRASDYLYAKIKML